MLPDRFVRLFTIDVPNTKNKIGKGQFCRIADQGKRPIFGS